MGIRNRQKSKGGSKTDRRSCVGFEGKRRAGRAFLLSQATLLRLPQCSHPAAWSESARAAPGCPGGHAPWWRGAPPSSERRLLYLKYGWSRTSPSGNGGSRLPCVFRPLCLLWKRPDYRLTLEWASIFIRRMGSRILAGWTTSGFLHHGMVAPPVELRDGRSIPLTFPFIAPAPSAAYFTF